VVFSTIEEAIDERVCGVARHYFAARHVTSGGYYGRNPREHKLFEACCNIPDVVFFLLLWCLKDPFSMPWVENELPWNICNGQLP